MAPEDPSGGLRVNQRLVIPERELAWSFDASGGPGGQHANTANTRVELVFDVEASTVLSDTDRARLLDRIGPRVRVVVGDARSQWRNRQEARERLAQRVAEALRTPRLRRPSRPGRGAVERRLEAKRLQSQRKRERRYRPGSGSD